MCEAHQSRGSVVAIRCVPTAQEVICETSAIARARAESIAESLRRLGVKAKQTQPCAR
jgi:hypothetical protein